MTKIEKVNKRRKNKWMTRNKVQKRWTHQEKGCNKQNRKIMTRRAK